MTTKNFSKTTMLLIAALAFCRVWGAPPDKKLAEVMKEVKAHIDLNHKSATANYNNDGYDRAIALLEKTLAEYEFVSDADRIATMKALAYAYLDRAQDVNAADIEKGHAILADAAKLPNLSDRDRDTARLNIADLLWAEFRRDDAAKIYRELREAKNPVSKGHCEYRLAELEQEKSGAAAALKLYRDTFGHGAKPHEMTEFCLKFKMFAEARPFIAQEIDQLATNAPISRATAIAGDLLRAAAPCDRAAIKAFFEPEFARIEQKFPEVRARFFGSGVLMNTFKDFSDRAAQEWFIDSCISCGANSFSAFALLREARKEKISTDRLAALARNAVAAYDQADANSKERARVKRDDLIVARLLVALDGTRNFKAASAAVDRMIKSSFPEATTNAVEQADILKRAGQLVFAAGRDEDAMAFLARREQMRAPHKEAELSVTFVEGLDGDISSILASDAHKKLPRGILDRKYGPNLQFLLETDASVSDREISKDSSVSAPTEFTAWAGVRGFKILLRSYERNTEAIVQGFASPIGYEMYFAPSMEAAYHGFFGHAASEKGLSVSYYTQYTGPNCHVKLEKGTVRTSWLPLADGVAMLIDIPWSVLYGFVPENGDIWQFEAIHWNNGGMTWGGSKSVHNRSSWGKLKFTGLTKAARTQIKRAVLPAAAANYTKALSARAPGCIDWWMDNDLGDRKFYLSVLKPMIDARGWDEDVKLVKAGMSDEEVNRIFDAHARDWMNIQEVVSRLRTEYLARKLVD